VMQHSTLKKLSDTLGVSISTVSRALKGHPDVSEDTRKKVKDLAEALEYEPNNNAVQLRTRKSNILGIMVPVLDNFFYDSFISAVEEGARKNGYSVLIMQSRDQLELETSCLQLFRKKMVTGLLASLSIEIEDMSPFKKLNEAGIPVIFFDRVPVENGFYKVCQSDEKSATIAAEEIIKKKKKKVLALFGHPHLSITQVRCAAFRKVFQQQAPDTEVEVYYPESIAGAEELVLSLLKQGKKYDVIFCMGDLILIGAMHAVHELNLNVPGDVGIISISNGLIPTLYKPKITHVETSGHKLGTLAFSQMLSCLQQQTIAEQIFLEASLVEGGSL
jgi:LacI family transcriptional regulator